MITMCIYIYIYISLTMYVYIYPLSILYVYDNMSIDYTYKDIVIIVDTNDDYR